MHQKKRSLMAGVVLLCSFVLAGCMTAPTTNHTLGMTSEVTQEDEADLFYEDQTGAITPIYEQGTDLEVANANIWDRVIQGFSMPDLEDNSVTAREQWYRERPNYFIHTSTRASRYLYYIVDEIERRGMPMELALLPYLESAYNPDATSHAQAAGMWQFIPSTGKNFDLQQDIFRDERRDVIASTEAALDYLQTLYNMFGDWHLALAAYNWGEGNVLRAIKNNERKKLPTDYLNLKLPGETQKYVPTLQALKNIVSEPEKYQVELPFIADHPFFQTVKLEQDIDVEVILKLADISRSEFSALNTAVNTPVVLVSATPQILLPWDNVEIFVENLQHYSQPLSTWTLWKTPKNMSISDAARANEMSTQLMQEANNIESASANIKKGSTLLVQRCDGVAKDINLAQVQSASLVLTNTSKGKNTKTTKNKKTTTAKTLNSRPSKVAVTVKGEKQNNLKKQSVTTAATTNTMKNRHSASSKTATTR